MGDDMVDIDSTPWYQVGQQLHDLEAQLNQTLAEMQADPGLAAAIGRDVAKVQSDLGDQISNYQAIYTLLTGSPDPGLSGVLIPAAIAAGIIALLAAVAIISHNWSTVEQAKLAYQNKSTQLAQADSLLKQAAAATAAGNTALAAQLYAQAAAAQKAAGQGAPFDFNAFLQQNGIYIAGAVVAALVLKR